MEDLETEDTETEATAGTDESPATAAPSAPTEKTVTLATKKLGELKRLAAERGRRDTLAEMDRKAQEQGFANWSAMAAAAAAIKAGGKPATATSPNREDSDDEQARPATAATAATRTSRPAADRNASQRDLALTRAVAAQAKATREARRARRELEATQAESQMRIAAFRAGVVDVDYGIHLLRQHLAKKPQAELQTFDEAKYFTLDLKKSHPHLYIATETPATTAPATGAPASSPASAGAGTGKPPPVGAGENAMKLSPKDFAELLRKRGYAAPHVGMSR